MKDLFVPYELALKLKEKGFKFQALAWYRFDKKRKTIALNKTTLGFDKENSVFIASPLWQQVFDWLWHKHDILICYNPGIDFEFYIEEIENALKLIKHD